MENQYQIAHLNDQFVKEIIDLESRMRNELGREITLVAYSSTGSMESSDGDFELNKQLGCRAGMDD